MSANTAPLPRWSLSDLFHSLEDDRYHQTNDLLEMLTADFENRREELTDSIQEEVFLNLVQHLEKIHLTFDLLYGYAGLKFYENTQDEEALNLLTRLEQKAAEVENRCLFFTLWWKKLPQPSADRLLQVSGDYRYWLEKLRKFKQYTLSENEEKIINLKNVSGVQTLSHLYDTITNRYVFSLEDIEPPHEVKSLTRDGLMVYVRHPNPIMRERAYKVLYEVFTRDAIVLGQIYQAIVQDWANEKVVIRRFASPITARNLENDLPDEVVDTLLQVCKEKAPLFQRYFKVKAKALGIDRLRRYDLYAPVGRTDKAFGWEESKTLIGEAFDRFDPQLADLAQRVFDDQHVDAEDRPGKQSGAFCWSVAPHLTPWVLCNFHYQVRDVTTLAHELGHAVHALLAGKHSLFTYQAPLPLAETASTFGEMLVTDLLLEQETDLSVRSALLFQQLEEAYATIMRQAFFALFERQAHAALHDGASPADLSEMYLRNLQLQFGDALDLEPIFRWEWLTIPHFYHTPFYVYAYSFGQLLVLALYQRYRQMGKSFVPLYLNILSAGGAQAPMELLLQSGMDISQPQFWRSGFDVIEQWIEECERIQGKIK